MSIALAVVGPFLLAAALAFGQTAPLSFEAVSIKPSAAATGNSGVHAYGWRLTMENVTLSRCIAVAYDLSETQILDGPKWIDEEKYDIVAKAAGTPSDPEMVAMAQSMLAERFSLVFHRETRQLPGYALVVTKTVLKAKASGPGADGRSHSTRDSTECTGCTTAVLAMYLAQVLHVRVADQPAAEGKFDFKLQWTPGDMRPTPRQVRPHRERTVLRFFAALQEQLGLKLEASKLPTVVLVVDRAEKASAN
jgi:uncharacterized protein (TIGR03435 family)